MPLYYLVFNENVTGYFFAINISQLEPEQVCVAVTKPPRNKPNMHYTTAFRKRFKLFARSASLYLFILLILVDNCVWSA